MLAHEQILQAQVVFIARTEPRFIDRLRARFVKPKNMARYEPNHCEMDECAEEFIPAEMFIGEARVQREEEQEMTEMKPVPSQIREAQSSSMIRPAQCRGVQVSERNGVWEVLVDGKFRGDYHRKEHAYAAADLHILLPR
ncbi:hypothetical protein KO491_17820 [Roseovarius nubinhibens]|nr:hypothetical protein [Roseovarius nubinhibens]